VFAMKETMTITSMHAHHLSTGHICKHWLAWSGCRNNPMVQAINEKNTHVLSMFMFALEDEIMTEAEDCDYTDKQ
jgi:hypothetical protein